MENEQTKKTDTKGKETDKPLEGVGVTNPILSEAKSLAIRIEEGNKKAEELLKTQESLLAEQALSGTGGGRQEIIQLSEEDQKVKNATEFFKDTALGDAIGKANKDE